jgi:hypothetical protein
MVSLAGIAACTACWLCTLAAAAQPPAAPAGSYLWTFSPGRDGAVETHVEPYHPQAGDIVLFDQHSRIWDGGLKMCGSGPPDHSGVVVLLPTGEPVIMEVAADDGLLAGLPVALFDTQARLEHYEGTVWIRQLKTPPSEEQSARMTDFALTQMGKGYAAGRFLLQLTPFRARGSIRGRLFGKTQLERRRWICSELVVATEVAGGLFDPARFPANGIYPLDLLEDRTYDLSDNWRPGAVWSPSNAGPPEIRPNHLLLVLSQQMGVRDLAAPGRGPGDRPSVVAVKGPR